MVSVLHSVAEQADMEKTLQLLGDGLTVEEVAHLQRALGFAWQLYENALLGSGESIWSHALGMAVIIAGLKLDADSRIDEEYLLRFVGGYQEVAPLTIGEVWAVPIMLRIALVENLARLSRAAVTSMRAEKAADRWTRADDKAFMREFTILNNLKMLEHERVSQ
jgi:GTP pyrophosphokinase